MPLRSLLPSALPLLPLLASCADDVAQPYQLDHARILAVRTDLAQLGPLDRSALEVLFTDSSAAPTLASPTQLEVRLAPELDELARPELAPLLVSSSDGWAVQAPDAATLDQARAALGLPAGQPLPLPLTLRVRTADGVLEAQKVVLLGTRLPNPQPPQLALEERAAGQDSELSLEALAMPAEASVRWFAWPGELSSYTQPAATWTLSPSERPDARLAVVVRTPDGGVTWQVRTLPAAQ